MTPRTEILVFGIGNPARGDDGLGPALAGRLTLAHLPGVEAIAVDQLAVEHAADIAGCRTVIFADAVIGGSEPFSFRRLLPRAAGSLTSHSLPPESLLALATTTLHWHGDAYLLAIRGHEFNEFREGLGSRARRNLAAAADALGRAIRAARDGTSRLDGAATGPPVDDTLGIRNGGPPCATASP